jgi:hypothetical protein
MVRRQRGVNVEDTQPAGNPRGGEGGLELQYGIGGTFIVTVGEKIRHLKGVTAMGEANNVEIRGNRVGGGGEGGSIGIQWELGWVGGNSWTESGQEGR